MSSSPNLVEHGLQMTVHFESEPADAGELIGCRPFEIGDMGFADEGIAQLIRFVKIFQERRFERPCPSRFPAASRYCRSRGFLRRSQRE